ncbi:DUF86 domain-containing protein [Hymenobacter psoromatis]|uniref:HepT-like ribonuclease domain-containing protein n=1 Tax=Hymenobacter psoromatis TaxID=1484116 RepID=UPI001CBCE085|nr:HepT-like ribonuclease domain-containing protein [Hymenobacter psoromatis]
MSKRLDSTILQKLFYAASQTQHSSLPAFLQDEDLQDIVLRQLTIVGEAAARVLADTRQHYSQIDWRRITGMRNFVAHKYFRVDFTLIWNAVTTLLPALLLELPGVLAHVLADEQSRQTPDV